MSVDEHQIRFWMHLQTEPRACSLNSGVANEVLMSDKFRRLGLRTALAILVVIVGMIGLRALRRVFLPLPMDRCVERRFDSAVWQDRTQAFTAAAPRGCMVDDLLRRHELVGQSRAAAVRLLGSLTRPITSVSTTWSIGSALSGARSASTRSGSS